MTSFWNVHTIDLIFDLVYEFKNKGEGEIGKWTGFIMSNQTEILTKFKKTKLKCGSYLNLSQTTKIPFKNNKRAFFCCCCSKIAWWRLVIHRSSPGRRTLFRNGWICSKSPSTSKMSKSTHFNIDGPSGFLHIQNQLNYAKITKFNNKYSTNKIL